MRTSPLKVITTGFSPPGQQIFGWFYGGISGATGDLSSGDSQDQASGRGKGGVQGNRRLHHADRQVSGCTKGGCGAVPTECCRCTRGVWRYTRNCGGKYQLSTHPISAPLFFGTERFFPVGSRRNVSSASCPVFPFASFSAHTFLQRKVTIVFVCRFSCPLCVVSDSRHRHLSTQSTCCFCHYSLSLLFSFVRVFVEKTA